MKLMIGLTGGIGAGKSAVSRRLGELGAVIIDADVIAREVVRPGTEGIAEIADTFGPSILAPDGSLDRPALGQVVFRDPGARARLEGIIHPRVRARTAEIAESAPDDSIVVNDVPLLVETGISRGYHMVLVVEAPEAVRVERLMRDRGMSESDARSRIGAQATDEERRAVADIVIANDGDLDLLTSRVDEVWAVRLVPAARS